MNDNQPLRRWAIGAALCLTLTYPLMATASEPASEALQQALTQRIQQGGETLPVESFYQLRDGQPAWQAINRVEALVSALSSLVDDGLTPSDYQAASLLDDFQLSQQLDAQAKASFDVRATRSLLLALDHLSLGKVNPKDVEPNWDLPRPERSYVLPRVVQAVEEGDVHQALAFARPASPEYAQLREALTHYRRLAEQGSVPYLPGREESLRPGDIDDDVQTLRQRLTLWGEPHLLAADSSAYPMVDVQASGADPRSFDRELAQAVMRFQRRHQLQEDGVVGERTRLALNMPVSARVNQLRINLERARWIRPSLERAPNVWVDIAGYRLHYTRPNGQHWDTRVVVGSPSRETPIIHSSISHLTVNPSWTIPPTIMREDVLPRIRRDEQYLARQNIQVVSLSGETLDASTIDWQRPGGVMLRQVAGSSNPLGRVVVRFPNNDMIYLHDTPARGLFQREHRALSSGCVRVEGVTEFAQLLLHDSGSRYQLNTLIANGRSDQNVNLPNRIPVALHYLTAWPNGQGDVVFREDIYHRDAALLAALKAV